MIIRSNFSKVVYNQIQDQEIKHLIEQKIIVTNLLTAKFKVATIKLMHQKKQLKD